MTAPLRGHGFSVTLPGAWEGRIYRRPTPTTMFAPDNSTARTSAGADAAPTRWPGDLPRAVVHLGNFPLPAQRGDYGSGAVERMTPKDTFIALVEFGPECLGTALYSPTGLPRTAPELFDPNALQRRIAGQAGCQFFFTEQNRPLCLYVVIGAQQAAVALSAQVNQVLDGITVTSQ
jgi:hypothetical protein